MALFKGEKLKHLLDTSEAHPADITQFDLARPGGWCPVGRLDDHPCPRPASPDLHATLALGIGTGIPKYLDTEVVVLERLLSSNIARVAIPKIGSDREMLCKVATTEMTAAAVHRELQCLLIIAATNSATISPEISPLARVPKLLGIVRSSDHGGVVGMLETFIPHAYPRASSEEEENNEDKQVLQTLYDMDLIKFDIVRRKKWIHAINETIAALHGVGITWSDVKADNVLIDSTTDEPCLYRLWGRTYRRMGSP